MSWKSFVSAGLLCVLASPAFAVPTVVIEPGGTEASGHLNADGDWVWRVRLYQTDVGGDTPVDIDNGGPITPGSPLAAELGFTMTDAALLDANNLGDGFDTSNPGTPIYGWENPGTGTNGNPNGLQSNCAGGLCTENTPGDDPNTVFAALGSVDYGTDMDGKNFIEIIADGPLDLAASLTTALQMLGAYTSNGRIGELNDAYDGDGNPPISLNHDVFAGAFSRTAVPGDANLDGDIEDADLALMNFNWFDTSGTLKWYNADFNGDGDVEDADLALINFHWFDSLYSVGSGGSVGGPQGSGGGGGGAVPEPATMALLALATLGLAGLRGRRA